MKLRTITYAFLTSTYGIVAFKERLVNQLFYEAYDIIKCGFNITQKILLIYFINNVCIRTQVICLL